jgi:Transposase DDE domain group 1
VKFTVNPEAIEHLFVQLFMAQNQTPPRQIILDMDVTDDPVHGGQEQAAFNGYYDHECYTPLLIYCGRHLLAAQLRPANVDPAAGALTQLQRIIAQIRAQWKEVVILVRGDSAYSRDDILSWCETQVKVEYVLAHASNARLRQLTAGLEQRAKAAYDEHRQQVSLTLDAVGSNLLKTELDALVPPQIFYQSLDYCTQKSWRCARRLVCKLTYGAQGAHRHFVVTSYTAAQISPGKLHQDYYCPRGEMENRIKEHQLDLFSDRTSTHEFESNQLRLWFSSMAYVLMQAFRQHLLVGTELADAQCGTIRLKLLKVGAQIRCSVRRIVIAISSHWAGRSLFTEVAQRLQQLPRPG